MKKLSLKLEDLEERIAPSLTTPGGVTLFEGMQGQGQGQEGLHPAIDGENDPVSPGPWAAHIRGPLPQ
jgi:hypothetical protein